MFKQLINVGIFLAFLGCFSPIFGQDTDYLRLKSEGDQRIQNGDYKAAELKFLAILEVPGFQLDAYARKQLSDIRRILDIIRISENGSDPIEKIAGWKQIVEINPADFKLRKALSQYYLEEAKRKESEGLWGDALELFVLAERYFPERGITHVKSELKGQVNSLSNLANLPLGEGKRSPNYLYWKVGLGAASLGSFFWAHQLNNQWNQAQLTFQAEEQRALRLGDFSRYDGAYQTLRLQHNKQVLRRVTTGVALVSLLGNVGFFVLPKLSKRMSSGWQGNQMVLKIGID